MSLCTASSGGSVPTGVLTGTATAGAVISISSGGNATWASISAQSNIKLTLEGGEVVELNGSDLLDIKFLLEAIKEIPDDHPLADIKRDLHVKRAVHTLSQGDTE